MTNSKTMDKLVDYTQLARWYNEVKEAGFRIFNTIDASTHLHYQGILNYFENRSTNGISRKF